MAPNQKSFLTTTPAATTVFQKMSQLYQMPYVYSLILRYTYEHFEKKAIVELIKCIWVYSDNHRKRCKVCKLYKNWAIEALEKKWLPQYIDFCTAVSRLKRTCLHRSPAHRVVPVPETHTSSNSHSVIIKNSGRSANRTTQSRKNNTQQIL